MKKLIVAALAASLVMAGAASGGIGQDEPTSRRVIAVMVDGEAVRFDQPPVMRGNRVLVPIRGVFEKLGANVEWLAERQMVVATQGEKKVELWINQRDATIDGAMKRLDEPAIILGGRAMVPLRFLSESLGADVRWNAQDLQVLIDTK